MRWLRVAQVVGLPDLAMKTRLRSLQHAPADEVTSVAHCYASPAKRYRMLDGVRDTRPLRQRSERQWVRTASADLPLVPRPRLAAQNAAHYRVLGKFLELFPSPLRGRVVV